MLSFGLMSRIVQRLLFTKPRLKVLSALFTDLSAGWIGAVIIFQNFSNLSLFKDWLILITDIIAAIVCLLVAFWLEERSEK